MRQFYTCAVLVGIVWALVLFPSLALNAEAFVWDWQRWKDDLGPCRESAHVVAATSGGELYVVMSASCGLPWNRILLKLDSGGHELWRRPTGTFHSYLNDIATILLVRPTNEVLLISTSESVDESSYHILIAEYSESGDLNWFTTYNQSERDAKVTDAALSPNGNLFISFQESATTSSHADLRSTAAFSPDGHLLWEYIFNDQDYEMQKGWAVMPTDDEFVYAVVQAVSSDGLYDTFWLVKISNSGIEEWRQPISHLTQGLYGCEDFRLDSYDDTIYIATTVYDHENLFTSYPFVSAFNIQGDRLWDREIFFDRLNDISSGRFSSLTLSRAGELYVLYSLSEGPVELGPHLTKLNRLDGEILWDTTLGNGIGVENEGIRDVVDLLTTLDNLVVITANLHSLNYGNDNLNRFAFWTFDSSGNLINMMISPDLNTSNEDWLHDSVFLPRQGIVMAGYRFFPRDYDNNGATYSTTQEAIVVLNDPQSGSMWSTSINNQKIGTYNRVYGLVASADGGSTLGGTTDTPIGWWDFSIVHRDAGGSIAWNRFRGADAPVSEFMNWIGVASDDSIVATGTVFSQQGPDVLVLRYDENGNVFAESTFPIEADDIDSIFTYGTKLGRNDEVVVAGDFFFFTPPVRQGTWAAQIDRDGSIAWKIDQLSTFDYTEALYDLTKTDANKTIVLTRRGEESLTYATAVLRSISESGQIEWEIEYDPAWGEAPEVLRVLDLDGDLFVVSTAVVLPAIYPSHIIIAHFSDSGQLLDEKMLDITQWMGPYLTELYVEGLSISKSRDSIYISAGYSQPFTYFQGSGAILVKIDRGAEPQWLIRIPSLGPIGWGPAGSYDVRIEIDELDRGYWAIHLGGVAYVAQVTSSGRIYSLAPLDNPYLDGIQPVAIAVAGENEFYVAGESHSPNDYDVVRIVTARYTNPCGTTNCPWLGSCVDVGDAMPGNVCMSCEMDGGFAQFLPVTNETVCGDDGRFCNGAETCNAGLCLPAGNPCTYPQLCMERDDECIDPIPIGQALPEGAVPTMLTPKKPETPDVNEVMFNAWWKAAKAEADGATFDPSWDDTDWSVLEGDDASVASTKDDNAGDEETGGCGE